MDECELLSCPGLATWHQNRMIMPYLINTAVYICLHRLHGLSTVSWRISRWIKHLANLWEMDPLLELYVGFLFCNGNVSASQVWWLEMFLNLEVILHYISCKISACVIVHFIQNLFFLISLGTLRISLAFLSHQLSYPLIINWLFYDQYILLNNSRWQPIN